MARSSAPCEVSVSASKLPQRVRFAGIRVESSQRRFANELSAVLCAGATLAQANTAPQTRAASHTRAARPERARGSKQTRVGTLGLKRVAAALALLTFASPGQEWARFRGPNGTGVSHAKTIPTKIAEADLNWKAGLRTNVDASADRSTTPEAA